MSDYGLKPEVVRVVPPGWALSLATWLLILSLILVLALLALYALVVILTVIAQ